MKLKEFMEKLKEIVSDYIGIAIVVITIALLYYFNHWIIASICLGGIILFLEYLRELDKLEKIKDNHIQNEWKKFYEENDVDQQYMQSIIHKVRDPFTMDGLTEEEKILYGKWQHQRFINNLWLDENWAMGVI